MRGLDRLRQIRREGLKPQGAVMFDTVPGSLDCAGWVGVDRGDRPGLADLRVFKGLAVLVVGAVFDVVMTWAKALCDAGADSVAVCVEREIGRVDGPAFVKFKGEVIA